MTKGDSKRHDILKAAVELFAQKGFRGTTTRDLATQADVNEAIIFRYFTNKTELYRAILEEKVQQGRDEHCKEVERLAATADIQTFLEFVGTQFLEKHKDNTFMRLMLFSALEGHELSDMFLASVAVRDPLAAFMKQQMDAGVFRQMDPSLAARAFLGMFAIHVQMQEIFRQKNARDYEQADVVRSFVSIFLSGMKA